MAGRTHCFFVTEYLRDSTSHLPTVEVRAMEAIVKSMLHEAVSVFSLEPCLMDPIITIRIVSHD